MRLPTAFRSTPLEIVAQAKHRLADEYDAAQERGDVARLDSNQHQQRAPHENTLATVADLGLTGKAIHEARQLRDVAHDRTRPCDPRCPRAGR